MQRDAHGAKEPTTPEPMDEATRNWLLICLFTLVLAVSVSIVFATANLMPAAADAISPSSKGDRCQELANGMTPNRGDSVTRRAIFNDCMNGKYGGEKP